MGDIGRSAQAVASIADSGIAAGATLGAAGIAKSASDHAADNSLTAAREANALQKSQFDTTQANQKPWMDAGKTGLNNITSGLGSKYNATYSGSFNDGRSAGERAPGGKAGQEISDLWAYVNARLRKGANAATRERVA